MAGEFLEAATSGDRALLGRLAKRFAAVIDASFRSDKSRMTRAEVKRRFEILEGVARKLRGDLGWSWPRILDELPRALRSRLDGIPWEPSTSTIWAPEDPLEGQLIWTPDGSV